MQPTPSKIIIKDKNGIIIPSTKFNFSGGEVQVRLLFPEDYKFDIEQYAEFSITCHARSSDDIMELLLITNALREFVASKDISVVTIYLILPYLPYARQDRVVYPGEALALRVMCDLINTGYFDSVEVWDIHSNVANNWINNLYVRPASYFLRWIIDSPDVLVAPDKGATERVKAFAEIKGIEWRQAEKIRDPNTGQITGTKIHSENIGDRNFVIVDDICDGGRTFIELAKVLRPLTTGKIILYVTHFIGSAGFEPFIGLIDIIYTPNSWQKFSYKRSFIGDDKEHSILFIKL